MIIENLSVCPPVCCVWPWLLTVLSGDLDNNISHNSCPWPNGVSWPRSNVICPRSRSQCAHYKNPGPGHKSLLPVWIWIYILHNYWCIDLRSGNKCCKIYYNTSKCCFRNPALVLKVVAFSFLYSWKKYTNYQWHVGFYQIHGYWLWNKFHKEKKEEIWLSPMTNTFTPTKSKVTTQNATKNFDNTTIADRLKTVSWSNTFTQLVWINRFTGFTPSH